MIFAQASIALSTQIIIFLVGAVLFIGGALITSRLIRPNRPSQQKQMTYESGETPQGLAWVQFNVRFYVLALVFLLFEVEIVFLFPWSVVFANKDINQQTGGAWSWFAFVEMLIFILILVLGLIYVWKKGHLDWVKSKPSIPKVESPVPSHYYEQINERYKGAKPDAG